MLSAAALFFLIWWLVLFATLPFGVRTQDEDEDVTLGTVASAPRGPHMRKTILRTTLIAVAIYGVFHVLTVVLGYTLEDLPRILPEF